MTQNRSSGRWFALFGVCLLGILLVLFHKSLYPSGIIFANDGPFGAANQLDHALPAGFFGVWYDLNTLGTNGGMFVPDITTGLTWLLGPLGCFKLYTPLTLAILGLCAWT